MLSVYESVGPLILLFSPPPQVRVCPRVTTSIYPVSLRVKVLRGAPLNVLNRCYAPW
jgi:hypothetical protein